MPRLIAFLLAAALLAGSVGWSAYRDALDRLTERGEADLSLAADRVTGQLLRYRELAVILARHPDLKRLLIWGGSPGASVEVVQGMADMTGASDVAAVDLHGRIVAGSNGSSVARDPKEPPLERALDGALGTSNEIVAGPLGPRRYFAFAAPVQSESGVVVGAVMTRVSVAQIEDNWPGDAPPVFFTDRQNRIFVTNRSGLVLADRSDGMPDYESAITAGREVWRIFGDRYLPNRAIHLQRDLPTIGMTAEILIDSSGAFYSAVLWGLIAAGALLTFGAILFFVQQKRAALADRLTVEAAANARLEARVVERTQELTEVNADLRREVSERKEAEAALKRAQDELVQAGKLSALGKMSAGISHELNQPLMAIRSFAENGEQFFDRGKPERARDNLGKISELARRMGRIIQNLRAFARQESGPVTDVDLVDVIDASLEMTADKIHRHEVELVYDRPHLPIMVRGGEVRLQQVVVNLVSNAVDAMSDAPERRLSLTLDTDGPAVRLTVRDSGPGIADPDRVFDPFYSTKEVGAAEGMGLGLSISYGLVQSFGGAIKGLNHPEGGAAFTVELVPAGLEAAA
ncbi:two-component system C4-dicarboxylate transport sensor histidine kinase DctB [Maritimibacter alkaliphilus HTCC2654]|uniref:C4-dicarboxylate transport sensor protein DctB n=1 Tax=Maritimibacter alkaliphilus HTCC2654 TaxID=314271 RepID=A3VCK1_9RHOB|nr:ATP-binding protein [Maritimibacter alkaliphilus]EAQ13867.1 C4-dicarboxylate transport sensor protein [Maritimibacter alkaliphilus HTCC2654]TYP84064.1 two-component system C4-dicarboxylate transport sensor histidine kinase DctB [Maritimibacter alkaliphilus HTCC2654]